MHKVALMITSCDAYSECWGPMILSLDKYWPDCRYPRYIVTNYQDDKEIKNTTFVKIGDDNKSWCTLAKKGLEVIEADYIIFFQEDYWLSKTVNNDAIQSHIDYMIKNNVDYLKICKDVLRDEYRIGETIYCDNPLDIRYALNTAMAIWKTSSISPLLIEGWSGWEFERQIIPYIINHQIKLNSKCLYSSAIAKNGLTDIKNGAIVRGVWTKGAVLFLRENGMSEIVKRRKIMGPITHWLYNNGPGAKSFFRWPFWGIIRLFKFLNINP